MFDVFCGKLTKPCHHVRTAQLVSQKSLASIIKKTQNFNKMFACRHHCHWGIGIMIIPSDLQYRPEQSHHLPGSAPLGDYRQSIETPMGVPTFNSIEKMLKFTIYDYILRLRQKKFDIS